jgi:His/Glu/Gln/Arg/opine family amino acid ABC transporter permease subunit
VTGYLPIFLSGAVTTLSLAAWAGAVSCLFGVVLASWRVSPLWPLRVASQIYVDTVRNIPVILLLLVGFFALPGIGISYSALVTAIAVLAASSAADVAEVLVAGFNSVSSGEINAAMALGLRYRSVLRRVVLPQAARTVAYPLGTALVTLAKNTSIASVIAVSDLTAVAERVGATTDKPVQAFGGAAAFYVVIVTPIALLLRAGASRARIRR